VLNHKDRSVTGRHYDKYEGLREKRRALDAWARKIETLIKPAPGDEAAPAENSADVIDFRRAAGDVR